MEDIPIWRMMSAERYNIRLKARAFVHKLKASAFALALRISQLPVITRLENDLVLFDVRTVFPEHERQLISAVVSAGAQKG